MEDYTRKRGEPQREKEKGRRGKQGAGDCPGSGGYAKIGKSKEQDGSNA